MEKFWYGKSFLNPSPCPSSCPNPCPSPNSCPNHYLIQVRVRTHVRTHVRTLVRVRTHVRTLVRVRTRVRGFGICPSPCPSPCPKFEKISCPSLLRTRVRTRTHVRSRVRVRPSLVVSYNLYVHLRILLWEIVRTEDYELLTVFTWPWLFTWHSVKVIRWHVTECFQSWPKIWTRRQNPWPVPMIVL